MYDNKQTCGFLTPSRIIKKFSMDLLVVASLLLLVACGAGSSSNPTPPPAPEPDVITNNFIQLGEVFSDDDSGVEFASTLIFSPSETGTFFIVAGVPGQFSPIGNFTISASTLTVPEDDFSNALDDTNAINLWETLDGVINTDTDTDTDTIPIWLVSGIPVDITAYGNDNGLFRR